MLMKPVPEADLAQAVRSLLDKTPASRSLVAKERWPFPGKITLLVADDDENFKDYLRREIFGATVKMLDASNGEEAVEVFRQQGKSIDVVLADLGIPGMGARNVAEMIWQMDPAAKIILMSGFGDWEQHREFFDEMR